MKTITRVLPTLLLLACSVCAQIKGPTRPSSWSAAPTPSTGVRAGISALQQIAPTQPRVAAMPSPYPQLGPILQNQPGSVVTTTTSAPVALGPGDLLDIGVFDSPELTTRVRISSEGDFTFPLLGKLQVAGMSPQQVQDLIERRLVEDNFVRQPQVAVFVSEYANQAVYVLGEVNKPGAYPTIGSHRLFDFVSAAGGFTLRAGRSITVSRHSTPDKPEVVRVSHDPKFTAENPSIGPGDTVYVGQAGVVYVVGEVTRSGGFLLDSDQHLTVMQALALAEGTKPTASLKGTRLVRTTDKGREEILLDLAKIAHSKSPDPFLQDRDIIYVPNSATRTGMKRGFETAIQAVVGAAIYRF
jgi:polysaccharide biosynthesis/export protein